MSVTLPMLIAGTAAAPLDGGLDDAAFDLLARTAGPRLLRTASLLVGEATASDLVQVALAAVWLKRSRIPDATAAEAFARRVMARQASSWWRRRWTRERPTEVLPDSGAQPPDVAQVLAVQAALATVSRRERAVLVLRYLDDLSEERTAETLGCSVAAVKQATRRGLDRLRAQDWEGFDA